MDVKRVHTFENQLKIGEQSRVQSNEFDPTNINVSLVDVVRTQRNLNIPLDEISLSLNLLVCAFDDYIMNAIEPTTFLSLILS